MSDNSSNAGTRFKDRYFTVSDGIRLHYRDYPGSADRPPLLCLHGLTRNARDWSEFADRYSPAHRVLVLEFRGRGDSGYDPEPARYNPLKYAADVIELLDQLGIAEAIFVGTSLGGLVTMTVAATNSKHIAATILNDIGPDVETGGIDRILSYVGIDTRFENWDAAADAIAAKQGGSFLNYTHSDWVKMARRNCREENGEIRFDYDMAIAEPFKTTGPTPHVDLWPLFAELAKKPLLVIRGERSDLLNASTFARMQEVGPGGKFATVAGVGHAPELGEPEAIAAIDRFLADI